MTNQKKSTCLSRAIVALVLLVAKPGIALAVDAAPIQVEGKYVTVELLAHPFDPQAISFFTSVSRALSMFGRKAVLELRYEVVKDHEKGVFVSPHGPEVTDELKRRLAISLHDPQALTVYLESLSTALNTRSGGGAIDWEPHVRLAGLVPEEIKRKMNSMEVSKLLEYEGARFQALGAKNARLMLFINGKRMTAPIVLPSIMANVNKELKSFGLGLANFPECFSDDDFYTPGKIGCCRNPGTAQAGFVFLEPENVELTVLGGNNDPLLPDTNGIVQALGRKLVKVKVAVVDAKTGEGASLLRRSQATVIPTVLLPENFSKHPLYNRLLRDQWIVPQGQYYAARIPGAAPGLHVRRNPDPDTLHVFVMSQCPYGVDAEKKLFESLNNGQIKRPLHVKIHFIADEAANDPTGFRSLHGAMEVEEDIRQLIVQNYFPDKFGEYLIARAKNYSSPDWQAAAKSVGLDVAKVEELSRNSGKKLMAEDIALANSLAINTSPTFLWENRYLILDRAPILKINGLEGIKGWLDVAAGGCGG